ncbi:MAG: universal stress protein [Dermatophilaceae bacterium]|nr:universal stress protein [Intrasporangiaceae bacterium]
MLKRIDKHQYIPVLIDIDLVGERVDTASRPTRDTYRHPSSLKEVHRMAEAQPFVVVGIDGSESSKRALLWAVGQADLTGAELIAVTAWHLPDMYRYVSRDYAVDAAHLLDAVLEEVLGHGRTDSVTRRVVEGGPVTVLLDAAKEAELLVLGSHGHGAFTGMLLGSVSQHCVHHATCPVDIVPLLDHETDSTRSTR